MSQPTRKTMLIDTPHLRLVRADGTTDYKPAGATAHWLFLNLMRDLGEKDVVQRLLTCGKYDSLYQAKSERSGA